MATGITLGIDLGTTNSCAAYVDRGQPRIVQSNKGYATLPSVVGVNVKGHLVVGHPAIDQIVTNPINTIYGSKRLVGRNFNSLVVQEMRDLVTYPIVEGSNGEAAVILHGKQYDLSEISALILAEMKQFAENNLSQQVTHAVVTVPAYYNDNQRQAVKRAASLAGLDVLRIVNEPTAAAIAYGFNRNLNQRILIYDFGGGTFDVSILEIAGNEFKVIATGGDTFLGGIDIDNRLTSFALEAFARATGKDLSMEKVAMQRVRNAAEQVKCDLSLRQEVEMLLPYLTEINQKPVDLRLKISRNELNNLAGSLVDLTLAICDITLESAQLKKSSIDEILLVGGQTRMPLVRDRIQAHFEKTPRKGVHPEEVVALGAAILSQPEQASSPVALRDVLSIPIGVALKGGKFKIILDRNMALPGKRAFKAVQKPGEEFVIDVFQGDRPRILENEYLGTFRFPAVAHNKRDRQLELHFELSPECLLSVQAIDMSTRQTIKTDMVTLQTPASLVEAKESLAPVRSRWYQRIWLKGQS